MPPSLSECQRTSRDLYRAAPPCLPAERHHANTVPHAPLSRQRKGNPPLLGVKRASFADAVSNVQRTGMLSGGVTAIGITDVPCYVDSAVMRQPHVVMRGGNRSRRLLLDPHELLKLPNVEVVKSPDQTEGVIRHRGELVYCANNPARGGLAERQRPRSIQCTEPRFCAVQDRQASRCFAS